MPADGLQLIQPTVLAGGRSRRFGRDKLIEPLHDCMLIDHPIRALRHIFGPRVAIVGACDPAVASRADIVIPDPYPGIGPIGGLLAALEYAHGPVFLLAGDLVSIDEKTVKHILQHAADSPDALAVVASTDRPQPCIGLYHPQASHYLRRAKADERHALRKALPSDQVCLIDVPPERVRNINRPDDLTSHL